MKKIINLSARSLMTRLTFDGVHFLAKIVSYIKRKLRLRLFFSIEQKKTSFVGKNIFLKLFWFWFVWNGVEAVTRREVLEKHTYSLLSLFYLVLFLSPSLLLSISCF